MKKFFLSFIAIVVLGLVSVVFAADPSYSTSDALYENGGLFYTISNGAFDTLSGVDSTTLFVSTSKPFDHDWKYVLTRSAFTGTGSDSVALQVRIDILDSVGTYCYSKVADSITSASLDSYTLPIFGSAIGSRYRIKLIGYTGNGGQVILNRFWLFKNRPITVNKNWK